VITRDIPNVVTLARLGVGAGAATLLAIGGKWPLLAALGFLVGIYVLDTLDGHLARAQVATRGLYGARVGGFLDGAVDSIVFSIIAVVLMRDGMITDWAAQTVVVSRMILMTVRGAAALGAGVPLGPTRLTKLSGGLLGVGASVVVAEAAIASAPLAGAPTVIGLLVSVTTSSVVAVSIVHYLATTARGTLRATIVGVDTPPV
jgi:phosphatidylglycerophosphate synthase